MKLLLVALFCIAAYNVAYGADPWNQEEGECGCCPLPCCCTCLEMEEPQEQPTCPPADDPIIVCKSPLNIGLIVDVSGSITDQFLPDVQDFLKKVLQSVAGQGRLSALVSYASNATIGWSFTDPEASSLGQAKQAIDDLTLGKFTNVVEGMELMISVVAEGGLDPTVPLVFVLLSDGRAVYRLSEIDGMAANLQAEGYVAVVGVTDLINESELNTIATSGTFTKVDNFPELKDKLNEIIKEVCEVFVVPTAPPCPTLPPKKVEGECFCCCPSPFKIGPPGAGYC